MPARPLAASIVLLLVAITAACGTAVFDHRIEVSFDYPSGRLGPAPVEVSIFDNQMGMSDEWARRTMGVSTPSTPYVAHRKATATKMIFDSTPPAEVSAGLAIPALAPAGYFAMDLRPQAGTEQALQLPFVPYGASPDAPVPALQARMRADISDAGGWVIRLTVHVPAALAPAR